MDMNARPRTGTPAGGIRLFLPADPPIIGDPSGRIPFHEASRFRAAAYHAKRVYPGAIGELLARELTAHAEFGYRFAADGLLTRLAAEVLRACPCGDDRPDEGISGVEEVRPTLCGSAVSSGHFTAAEASPIPSRPPSGCLASVAGGRAKR